MAEVTASETKYGNFTLSELVDLALCSPEVGTVNFNILRLLLHDIVEKLGIESMNVTLGDVQTNQIENYKNYIAGNSQMTPMPGVLRVTPPGYSYGVKTVEGPGDTQEVTKTVVATTPSMAQKEKQKPNESPRTPRTGGRNGQKGPEPSSRRSDPNPKGAQTASAGPAATTTTTPADGGKGSRSNSPSNNGPTSPRILDLTKALEDKVLRLERHLEALYQLPTNSQLLDGEGPRKSPGMTVNDMWQIIQLNNRVASCESAIQKMATLIEDLATDLNNLKGDSNNYKADAEYLKNSHSRLSTEMPDLSDKCTTVQAALDELKKEVKGTQHEWKKEMDKVLKIIGIDSAMIPSFLKPTPSSSCFMLVTKQTVPQSQASTPDSDQAHSAPTDNSNPSDEAPLDFRTMSPESLAQISVSRIQGFTAKDLEGITPSMMENMLPELVEKINEIRDAARLKVKDINFAAPSKIKNFKLKDLAKLTPEEAAAIKPSKLVHMTNSQLRLIENIKENKGQAKTIDFNVMDPEYIAQVPASEMANMTASEAAGLDESVLKFMTSEQRQMVESIKAKGMAESSKSKGMAESGKAKGRLDSTKLTPSKIGQLTPSEIIKISPSQMDNLTEEQVSQLNPDQQQQISNIKKQSIEKGTDQEKRDTIQSIKDPKQKLGHRRHSHPHRDHHGHGHDGHSHSPVDVIRKGIPVVEPLPPGRMNQEETKEIVQAELQKQYAQLQIQQRQLANDIHEKMEFVYQKLLRDIVTQNDTAVPYMSAGSPDVLGPGVCTGAGMPAGVAVCQFPEAEGRHTKEQQMYDPKVCPGPGICPASANCPNCNAFAMQNKGPGPAYMVPGVAQTNQMQQPQKGKQLRASQDQGQVPPGMMMDQMQMTQGQQFIPPPENQEGPVQRPPQGSQRRSAEDQLLVKEMRSLVLLDIDQIRRDMKGRDFANFDEQDVSERLDTVWEAIKIIKNNEETLAVKILRQDAILKKLPTETIDRIHKIPAENLEAIASAKWDKPMMLPGHSDEKGAGRRSVPKPHLPKTSVGEGHGSMEPEDVQNIYNNMANIIADTTEHSEKLQRLTDLVRTMEVGMVTKQMLVDALNDKADKGQINTKVSYDEFGTALDELNTNIRDLVNEGLDQNDHWKQVTDELSEDVSQKLDKVELSPIKAFFKSNIKALDDKVRQLQLQIEEPDPAGSRKKLLRDYNCISCDRHCNISGITNAPTLPVIGPIVAGHTTASKRAFDLHRMRIKKKFDQDCRDLPMMERQLRSLGLINPDGSIKNESELHRVCRYQGGSHTAITSTARVRASHAKKASFLPDIQQAPSVSVVGGGDSTQKLDQIFEAEEGYSEMEIEEEQEESVPESGEFLNEGFMMPEEDLEQAEETEQLLQSYIPTYIEE